MRAIQLLKYGNPAEDLQLVELPEPPPPPGPGEALIGVEYAPVNLNDLLLARGAYAHKPALPAVIGNEGVGRVIATSASHLRVGDRVLLPLSSWTWRERMVVPTKDLFALPDADPQQLAMLGINPPTAALLLDRYVKLEPGDWVLQNAANSGVGRWVIALAKARGLRTLNIVRSPELAAELTALGADLVLTEGSELAKRAREKSIKLAIDGVAGPSAALLAGLLGERGTLLSYAAMSNSPIVLSPLDVIFKPLTVQGFFLGHPQHAAHIPSAVREAASLLAQGAVSVPVAASYPLERIKEAVEHALGGGKVLLAFD